jgi:hypothetical protein
VNTQAALERDQLMSKLNVVKDFQQRYTAVKSQFDELVEKYNILETKVCSKHKFFYNN